MIQGIINILITDTAVQNLVGKNKAGDRYKVFPVIAPQEEVEYNEPFNLAFITSVQNEPSRCVAEKDYQNFDLLVCAPDYGDMDALSRASRIALDNQKGTFGGVKFDSIRFQTWRDDFDVDTMMYVRICSYLTVEDRKLNKPV